MKRRVHFEMVIRSANESDTSEDSEVACYSQAELEVEHMTQNPLHVTCKRCLQRMQGSASSVSL